MARTRPGAATVGETQVPPDDEVLAALGAVLDALAENDRRTELLVEKGQILRRQRAEGRSWAEIVQSGERPLVVELLSDSLQALTDAGARFRRAQARALYRDGVTMEQIAELFGVSRQRVSHLLRAEGEDVGPPSRRGDRAPSDR